MIPEVTISREIKVNLFMLAATEGSKVWSFDIGNIDLDKMSIDNFRQGVLALYVPYASDVEYA